MATQFAPHVPRMASDDGVVDAAAQRSATRCSR